MEGGYVNEEDSDAIIGVESPAVITFSNTRHTQEQVKSQPQQQQQQPQNSLLASNSLTQTANLSSSLSSSPAPATSSSSPSPLLMPALAASEFSTAASGSEQAGAFHEFLTKLRNLKIEDARNFHKNFHFDFITKESFFGGQLKTKNGQKYVFNGPTSGTYVSKTCMTLTAIVAILAIISSVLLTYFLTANSIATNSGCTNGHGTSLLEQQQRVNESMPVATASMLGMAPPKPIHTVELPPALAPVGDILTEHDIFSSDISKVVDRKLQLYEGWRPEHYNIVVEPNIAESFNNGSISIEIVRDPKVSTFEPIVLDVHNVSISNVRVIRAPNATNEDEVELDFDSEYGDNNASFVLTLAKSLAVEQDLRVVVSMDFVSQLTDTLQGIYKISYLNTVTNKQEWMVSTQFSPIDARRAFPCFDRPDMKANFTISIIRETAKAMALSNMPVQHTSVFRRGYTRDDFMTTPKMPTYLVAFIVSNMVKSHYSDLDANLVPRVEIWTRPEFTDMTSYAYSMVRKFLPFYEEYFGIKNKLPKLDLVSVPDFGFAGMENWGLITFRDSSLLVPEDLELASSSEHMEHVAQIIAHELAHSWFGNLVTPKWWDDLWLKEGFACYMSYIALNAIHPEYQVMDTFTVYEFKESMIHDADNTSHAISFDVKSTNDIRRIFDSITYSKGTILLRMLNSIVGAEAFRTATQDLLQSHAYQNADRNDLWQLMTQHGHAKQTLPQNLDIKKIMDSWITQPGYPVVTVERRNADLIITQERYLLPVKNDADKSRWVIPITFETDELHKGDNIPTHWMTQDDEQVVIEDVFTTANNSDIPVYLNLNRQGYYRVNYDMPSWLALKKKFATLPRITRAQLVDDAFHLAQAEFLTYDIPLTFLMELFTAVDDELLWKSAYPGINNMVYSLQREPAYEMFRAFMKFIVRPAFDRYGLNEPDNESHLQLQHRALVASLACKFNYDRCTQPAHLKFREWMRDPNKNPIKPNLKPVIYCTALSEGSFQEWYFAYKQYKRSTSASEKEQILSSLGCTTKPWLLAKYLNMTINSTSGILKQDGVLAFTAVASNPIGYEIAFDFLQTNIKEIAEYYGDGFLTVSQMITSITVYMNKDYHKQQLKLFGERARALGLKPVETAVEMALEQVNINIYWRNRSYYSLKGFLESIVSEFQINIF